MSQITSHRFLICLGFGSMTFVGTMVYDLIFNTWLHFKGTQEHFTFGRWLVNMMGVIIFISMANVFFSRILEGDIKWALLPQMIFATFAIGIFPVFVSGAINLLRQEKKYQNIALEINQKNKVITSPESTNGRAIFDVPTDQIRYIEALQNYVKIGYVDLQGQLIEQTERATLKAILEEITNGPIVQCHRSFLVNRTTIISIEGNAQGLVLTLADCDKPIPVSRSYVAAFRAS
jgi:hypothetical protein